MKSNTPFESIQTPDIHYLRRVEVLKKHPEVKKLMGYDPWAAVLTLFIVAGQLTFAWAVGIWFPHFGQYWWQIILLSYVVGGTMNHWAAMAVHEMAHNLMLKTPAQNKALAIIANIPVLVPGAIAFRRHHMKHHSHLGIEQVDNDFPSHWEVKMVGKSGIKKFVWLFFYIFFLFLVRGFDTKPTRWEWANIITLIITDILIFVFLGKIAIIYLLLSTLWGFSLHPSAGHFIHEHFVFKEGQETNSYYGWLNLVCFNVGYHNEHHDIMNIPGRFLPRYYKITKEFYEHLDSTRSWTRMFYDFITQSRLGADKRYVRTEQIRLEGLKMAESLRQNKELVS
ncbi:sphingolipid delta-4 desaturase [Mucilaginibacter sp. OK268]|jgi:sphingolipid delta-4 desaturase|uniref:fatty acid desaturase n=1 Tax=Mucilaginibacter sp. OK268 TaxID=1881048 RepID=UPI0008869E35|nr:fatty acid desaturase [Mucilaginibacter sp. OK268]SDP92380.1 sphingolipid delta-4 desaturase [Mucilaginibacter sp. OK268]